MAKVNDQAYLLSSQYKTAANLNARIQLHARFSANKQGWQRWLFEQLSLPERCSILELGCGAGNLWRDNLERLPRGWRLTLTDFSAGMVDQARRTLPAGLAGFAVADAQHIPFADGVFGAVFAHHMLYHVPDRPQALAEIRRVLALGGRVCAATVGATHMRELDELVMRFDPLLAESGIGLGKPHAPFSLENGAEQLARWFEDVTVLRYPDALDVTEAQPLVAYIMSGMEPLGADRVHELTRLVERELAERGVIHITKDTGVLVATR